MYLFTQSQEAEQRLKATNSFLFFHCLSFRCSLKAFVKSLQAVLLFLAGRCWLLASCHCDGGDFGEPCQSQRGLARSKHAHVPLAREWPLKD